MDGRKMAIAAGMLVVACSGAFEAGVFYERMRWVNQAEAAQGDVTKIFGPDQRAQMSRAMEESQRNTQAWIDDMKKKGLLPPKDPATSDPSPQAPSPGP